MNKAMMVMAVLAGAVAGLPAANAADGERGPEVFAIHGTLTVCNNTPYFVDVYVNGVYRGRVDAGCRGFFYVGQSCGSTQLYAVAPFTPYSWSHTVCGNCCDYVWVL